MKITSDVDQEAILFWDYYSSKLDPKYDKNRSSHMTYAVVKVIGKSKDYDGWEGSEWFGKWV